VGETRVDLQHLLEDLRDAYTGSLEETILTEIIANSLDSGAASIRLFADPAAATLTVVDDGHGMQRRELARYHDVAASTKSRGEGIGFAGVGIKLGLLVSREVVTETRRGATHVATRWHLASRHRAPWKWIPAPGLVPGRGTAVRLVLANPLASLLDAGYLAETVGRHFEPLLDPLFGALLARRYAHGVTFEVDGRGVGAPPAVGLERVPLEIRMGRRRTPSAVGYMALHDRPLGEDRQGIAISTHGKIIKRGWDWLGLTPAAADRVTGIVEAPDLAGSLTLNKSDFIRTGQRGSTYVAYRKALQEVVSRQLELWGDGHRQAEARPQTTKIERDLQRVLEDLADAFPLLNSLVERRAGGQRRLPLPGRGDVDAPDSLFPRLQDQNGPTPAASPTDGPSEAEPLPAAPPRTEGPPPGEVQSSPTPPSAAPAGVIDGVRGRRRPAHFGLMLGVEARADDPELGRLVENTVWINSAHPAYTRATASRSLGYHIALTVALALAPLAVEAAEAHAFVTRFLAYWGASGTPHALGAPKRRGTRPDRPGRSGRRPVPGDGRNPPQAGRVE
jgi:hypothetical protein